MLPANIMQPTFESTYADLPERFYARTSPTPVSAPRLLRVNEAVATELGLDPEWLASDAGLAMLAGNATPDPMRPIAMAYAGHQFGNFVPQLGDGRAILLGERLDRQGRRFDIQLKGAGPTPFSRNGDGRAAIGPVIREYVVSEAMAALGVPTTRALAAVTTGDPVHREAPLPGAILARVARGHIRVGTFEYFACRRDTEGVRALADYAIARLHPEAAEADAPYLALLESVVRAQAELVAHWLGLGFIHGVMNTDNTSIAGETIDYGPCAFLDTYDPDQVFSSIDHGRRYAYGRQPAIASWNVTRFAETLLSLLDGDEDARVAAATAALEGFEPAFQAAWRGRLRNKLGFAEFDAPAEALTTALLEAMATQKADFTRTFRGLLDTLESDGASDAAVAADAGFDDPDAFVKWAAEWRQHLAREGRPGEQVREDLMHANPALIPRNHRIEEAIVAATAGNLAPFERLVEALASPFVADPRFSDLAKAPEPHEVVHQTFCGT